MPHTIFYSWQSDLHPKTNRYFIEDALKKVCKKSKGDDGTELYSVDRDTMGEAGSPDISTTILAKIEKAAIFVADISIVVRGPEDTSTGKKPRACPNPNVLFELGYAVRAMGFGRTVLLFNTAYGEVEELPFDLKSKRILPYHLAEGEKKQEALNKLVDDIASAVEKTLDHAVAKPVEPPPDHLGELKARLESKSPALVATVRTIWSRFIEEIKKVAPWGTVEFHQGEYTYEEFCSALEALAPAIIEFSRACQLCAQHQSRKGLSELYAGFRHLAKMCEGPKNLGVAYSPDTMSIFQFLVHETFVIWVSAMLEYTENWELLGELLEVSWGQNNYGQPVTYWSICEEYLNIFEAPQTAQGLKDLRGKFLVERYRQGGPLNAACSLEALQAADFFVLWSITVQASKKFPDDVDRPWNFRWVPWSCRFASVLPDYLVQATSNSVLTSLRKALRLDEGEDLSKSLTKASGRLCDYYGKSYSMPGICFRIRDFLTHNSLK